MPDLTLIEKLRQIANAKRGDPMPECLRAPSTFNVVAKDPKSGVSVGLGSDDWARRSRPSARKRLTALRNLKIRRRTRDLSEIPVIENHERASHPNRLIWSDPHFGVDI